MRRWLRVPVEALAPDGRAVAAADGIEVAVFRADGRVHAFANACPHAGNPLADGDVVGSTLECVYHGWRFDLETGACLRGDLPARRFPAEVRGDEIVILVE